MKRVVITVIATLLLWGQAFALTDKDVETKKKLLINELLRVQKGDGTWEQSRYTVGMTALAVLALTLAEVPKDHPAIQKALKYLVNNNDGKTYSESLVAVALAEVDPKLYKDRIRKAARFLETRQATGGGWSYGPANRVGASFDNSNTQFAALGLGAAKDAGVEVDEGRLAQARGHWINTQNPDGGWGYTRGSSSEPMTCAGLASMYLLEAEFAKRPKACGEYEYNETMQRSLKWITDRLKNEKFNVRRLYYTLYALERVAIFLGIKKFGNIDWYRWGAEKIVAGHPASVSDKALALLFLAKGSAPIAVAKWEWKGDWNNQFSDVRKWCEYTGDEIGAKLDWLTAELQKLDSPAAKASLIFITGTQRFAMTEAEAEFLKAYLDAGGTVVAETSCNARRFVASFKREVQKNLYPDLNPRWVPVTKEHPVTWIKHRLPLRDVRAVEYRVGCKKLNLVVLEKNISCPLNGDLDVQDDLPRAKMVATNLLAWAMKGRKATKKLDTVKLEEKKDTEGLTPDQLRLMKSQRAMQFTQPFGRLKHSGNYFAAPKYFPTLKELLKMRENFPKFDAEVHVHPLSKDLFNSAVVFVTGYDNPMLANAAVVSLRTYVKNGGTIFGANACSSDEFDRGFRMLVSRIFPNDKLEQIPYDDPIYKQPFDLNKRKAQGTEAYRKIHQDKWAPLYGIRREKRWVLIYSRVDLSTDISEGLHDSILGYRRESAAALSVNILYNILLP